MGILTGSWDDEAWLSMSVSVPSQADWVVLHSKNLPYRYCSTSFRPLSGRLGVLSILKMIKKLSLTIYFRTLARWMEVLTLGILIIRDYEAELPSPREVTEGSNYMKVWATTLKISGFRPLSR